MSPRILAPLAILAVLVLAAVVVPPILDQRRSDVIADGVRVGGVDVGGMTQTRAREVLAERLRQPARRDVRLRHGEETFRLQADDVDLQVDLQASVEEALARSREGNPWTRTLREITGDRLDVDLEPRLRFDADAVGDFVDEVAATLDREARNADIDPRDGELTVIESEEGFRVAREPLTEAIVDTLERPRSDREIEIPGEEVEPDRTAAELAESLPLYLIVDRTDFRLRVYEELELDETYAVGVGQAGHETPAGSYEISNKAVDPAWYVPDEPWAGDKRGEVIPPDDPENPIVSRWLGIEDGIGIHGTDQPDSIGTRASHGCIRMRVPEVEELYDRVPVGTPVYIS